MKAWWRRNADVLPISDLQPIDKRYLEDFTGRIPMLLNALLHVTLGDELDDALESDSGDEDDPEYLPQTFNSPIVHEVSSGKSVSEYIGVQSPYHPQLPELLYRFKGLPEVELMMKMISDFYDSRIGGCTDILKRQR